MTTPQSPQTSTAVEQLLDKHAEYYIKQTMKFFQENGESPALSKNNEGDLEAKAKIAALIRDAKNIVIGGKKVEFQHTAVNLDMHLFIDGDHNPAVCPECIQPGLLVQLTEEVTDHE